MSALRCSRRALLVLLAAIVGGVLAGGAQAAADPVEDKREEAARIADRIEALGTEIEILAEQYNAATIQLADINRQVAEAEQRLTSTQSELGSRKAEVQNYAVEAYVRGGGVETMPFVLQARTGTDAGRRAGYLGAATGDREQIIDDLRAASEDLSLRQAELGARRAEAEAVAAEIDAKRRGAEAAVAEQQRLYGQAQGELADLVRQVEEQREAERQAAARARQAGASQSGSGAASAPAPGPAPPVSGAAGVAVRTAHEQLGDPYQWGAAGPDAFDCSGLTMYAWAVAGVSLPHNSAMQYSATRRIDGSQLQPGDLVFYGFSSIHHVAIYVGGGQIVHAPHAGDVVRLDSIHYWDDLRGYGRVG